MKKKRDRRREIARKNLVQFGLLAVAVIAGLVALFYLIFVLGTVTTK